MPSACLGNNCCDRDHIPKDEKQRECAPHARVVAKAPVKAWERRFYGAAADKELVKILLKGQPFSLRSPEFRSLGTVLSNFPVRRRFGDRPERGARARGRRTPSAAQT